MSLTFIAFSSHERKWKGRSTPLLSNHHFGGLVFGLDFRCGKGRDDMA
jgi:hypothetical protein